LSARRAAERLNGRADMQTSGDHSRLRRLAGALDDRHWAILALAAPALLFPGGLRLLALLVIPALWLAARLAGRAPIPVTPLNPALLAIGVMLLVSLYATYDLNQSLAKITGLLLGLAAYYAVVRVGRSPRGWWLALGAFLLGGAAIAALALVSTRWIPKIALLTPIVAALPPRISGLPGAEAGLHPNEVAGALLWVLPPAAAVTALAITRRAGLAAVWGRRRTRAALGAAALALGLLLATLVLAQSRGAYLALAGALLALAAPAMPGGRRARVLGGLALGLAPLVALAAYAGAGELAGPAPAAAAGAAFSLDTLASRLELWSRALQAIRDFPLTGVGLNTFRELLPVLYPMERAGADFDFAHAHNEFLQAALDLGLPGLAAFVALTIGAFSILGDTWRRDRGARLLVLGLAGGLFAHLLYGLTDAVALGAKPGLLFWMLLGLIAARAELAATGPRDG
jgi:O-antigen ligase